MFALCSGGKHCLKQYTYLPFVPGGDTISFKMGFYTYIPEYSTEQGAFSALLKRCAEMLKINGELLLKCYKHRKFCRL